MSDKTKELTAKEMLGKDQLGTLNIRETPIKILSFDSAIHAMKKYAEQERKKAFHFAQERITDGNTSYLPSYHDYIIRNPLT